MGLDLETELNDHRLKAGGLGPAAESRLKGVAVGVVVPASWPQTTSVIEAKEPARRLRSRIKPCLGSKGETGWKLFA